jgi:hypothetical protein
MFAAGNDGRLLVEYFLRVIECCWIPDHNCLCEEKGS